MDDNTIPERVDVLTESTERTSASVSQVNSCTGETASSAVNGASAASANAFSAAAREPAEVISERNEHSSNGIIVPVVGQGLGRTMDRPSITESPLNSPSMIYPTSQAPNNNADNTLGSPAETSPPQSVVDQARSLPPIQNIARQFPPPGTLVVVQGVVHTTDVPRQSNLSHSPEAPASSPRSSSLPPAFANESAQNRLSSLLRSQPDSGLSSQPSSVFDTLPSSSPTSTPNSSQPGGPSNDILPPSTRSQTEVLNSGNSSSSQEPISNDPPQPGTISSSSIDVLGTLLSVAAAATAASLLTGTTEPMLPPSIAPPAYNSSSALTRPPPPVVPSPPILEPSRPASPTSVNSSSSAAGPDPAAARRAERLRHAWGSIRERLGLRPAPPTSSPSIESGSEIPTPPSNDPRELVLAQMARAFNLGFNGDSAAPLPTDREGGDTGESQRQEETTVGTTQNETNPSSPSDGSFERFLVDLQADLRAALTNSHTLSNAGSNSAPASDVRQRVSAGSHAPAVGGSNDFEYQDARDLEGGDDEAIVSSPSEPNRQSASSSLNQAGVPSDNDLSPLSTRTDRPTIDSQETEVQGRINWWRLYRFPPITTRNPGVSGVPAVRPSSTMASPRNTTRSSDLPSQDTMDPTLSQLPFASPDGDSEGRDRTHSVVPVIVVGLQSVNSSWPQVPPSNENNGDGEPMANIDDTVQEESSTNANTIDPSSNPSEVETSDGAGLPPSSRGRAWHRAAEALRNLRTGRRNRATPAPTASGSRTFLIYVIGGYYPPDHNIVTGGPNTLDSFEALLELAELLGQVKPPTVSKEDIERSGLEIIKATNLQEYEREEKIASNCIDRCLICLDDYQPEDDVRIMRCRHAFHMICVDKWLETGRNNCPACRSRGVSNST